MAAEPFTIKEKEDIARYFGVKIEDMDVEQFEKLHKQLRQKYHPDKFEKFEDETVREMATEKFQQIEKLAGKIRSYFKSDMKVASLDDLIQQEDAQFAFNDMQIELITTDKDLKYHLFGLQYRWLERGDRFKIPKTSGSIIIDDNHRGRSMGFRETIRMYLTFGTDASLYDITTWLYEKIKGRTDSLIIEKKHIKVEFEELLREIMRKSYLSLAAPES